MTALPGFGVEIEYLQFHGLWDWFIAWSDVTPFWIAQPTYVLVQILFILGAVVTLNHAWVVGGRWPYLWVATVLHGLIIECITYVHPEVDNFWHSQTPLIFFGRRLPLYIILLYPCFIYQATVAVTNMNLKSWTEPFAGLLGWDFPVGLLVVLIDMPYDLIGVRFVHWTWDDTDPNIADRHYAVPWTSYYFHCSFAASFTLWFHASRQILAHSKSSRWQASSIVEEVASMIIASLLGAPGGVLLFMLLYHPLHDLANVHSEVAVFMLASIFIVAVWTGSRSRSRPADIFSRKKHHWFLVAHLIAHYSLFLAISVWGHPEQEISIGLHQTTGPCHNKTLIHNPFSTIEKRTYLCVDDYDEDYFDFHCLPGGKGPTGIARWYTVCGKPFPNQPELVAIIATIAAVAAGVFANAYTFIGNEM